MIADIGNFENNDGTSGVREKLRRRGQRRKQPKWARGKDGATGKQRATIEVPRNRNSTFEPVIVPKHEKRGPLFNDQIVSMYSFGMSELGRFERVLQIPARDSPGYLYD
jgi:transposase-like protein